MTEQQVSDAAVLIANAYLPGAKVPVRRVTILFAGGKRISGAMLRIQMSESTTLTLGVAGAAAEVVLDERALGVIVELADGMTWSFGECA